MRIHRRLMIFAVAASAGACLAAGRGAMSAAPQSAAPLDQGRKLFRTRCGICHGATGTGTFMLARRLGKERALLESRTDLDAAYIRKIARVGVASMPPLNRIELPDGDLDLIAAYLTQPDSARPDARQPESKPKTQKPATNGAAHE